MDSAEYRTWWQLHVRAARGEQLAPHEQTAYEATLRELDAGEAIGTLAEARNARQAMRALEAEHSRLEGRRHELEKEIAHLEGRLGESARQLLVVEE